MSFETVTEFEKKVSKFFGAPYGIAVDSCTHGVELALRYTGDKKINVPNRTYLSIPMLANKMNLELTWRDEEWEDYYTLNHNDIRIIDAAVLWRENSYVPGTIMSLSFQFKKHLSLGRGGMILCDDKTIAQELKKMSYDGRHPDTPWRKQNVSTFGYHYYMTPETAKLGLTKLEKAINTKPKKWVYTDWPDLTKMDVFNKIS